MQQLIDYLQRQLVVTKNLDATAIMCGHYPLVIDNGATVPGIYQDIQNPELRTNLKTHPYASEFPLKTFQFGIRLIGAFPNLNPKIVSLVNDWQMVPKNKPGDKNVNPFRKQYYESAGIPASYRSVLEQVGIGDDIYFNVPKKYRFSGNALHFSESKLRDIYDRTFSASCPLGNSCAQEFVPFLKALHESGTRTLVAVIPATCQQPTTDGIRYVLNDLKLDIDVWAVYVYQTTNHETFWDGALLTRNGEHELLVE